MTLQEYIHFAHTNLFPLWEKRKEAYPLVPFSHIVGLCYVENSPLDPRASRFEPGVYTHILTVKKGRKTSAYPGMNPPGRLYEGIVRFSQDSKELKSLASSWGLGQIMGYSLWQWGIDPCDYMTHTRGESLRMLMKFYTQIRPRAVAYNAVSFYEPLLRIWNTGRPNGTTHSPFYVAKAQEAAKEWERVYVG